MLELVIILAGIIVALTALLFWATNKPCVCSTAPATVSATPAYEKWKTPSLDNGESLLDTQFTSGVPSQIYSQMGT